MKKNISVSIIVIGTILLFVGLFWQIPGKELTTFPLSEDEYSVIDEYVGGDAYNYIIGASLVGGEIAGAKTQKAIFVSVGLLIICFGLYAFSNSEENNIIKEPPAALLENKNNIEESPINEEKTEEAPHIEHMWLCNTCNKLRDKSPCPYCGNE